MRKWNIWKKWEFTMKCSFFNVTKSLLGKRSLLCSFSDSLVQRAFVRVGWIQLNVHFDIILWKEYFFHDFLSCGVLKWISLFSDASGDRNTNINCRYLLDRKKNTSMRLWFRFCHVNRWIVFFSLRLPIGIQFSSSPIKYVFGFCEQTNANTLLALWTAQG